MKHLDLMALCLFAATAAHAQADSDGQNPGMTEAEISGDGQDMALGAMGTPEAAITTQLTYRSHTLAPFSSGSNLEGTACPAPTTMVSGACHPGYNDRVNIINQYPNVGANTWRCGFRNNNATSRTVWIYTLCAQ